MPSNSYKYKYDGCGPLSCLALLTFSVFVDASRSQTSLRRVLEVASHTSDKKNPTGLNKTTTAAAEAPYWNLIGANANTSLNFKVNIASRKSLTPEQQCNIISEFGRMPLMCMKGHDRFGRAELKKHIPQFMDFWRLQQQILPNHCCMGVNHMFALHFLVSTLQPSVIIESGVAAGHQTFMLRNTARHGTRIFSIDPGDPAMSYPKFAGGIGHWKDDSGFTTYLTGASFQDFAAINWGALIPDPGVRANTLVVLDDHQSCIERVKVLRAWGFKWAFYEDNYPFMVATSADPYTCANLGNTIVRDFPIAKFAFGDAYSMNAVCGGPLPEKTSNFIIKDRFGTSCTVATRQDQLLNVQYLREQMEVYFEFPVLYTPCKSPRPPLLDASTTDLVSLGLPTVETELWHYGHLFPSFVELTKPSVPVPS